MQIWLFKDGVQQGPFDHESIRQQLMEGRLSLGDAAWIEGWNASGTLGQIPGLSNIPAAAGSYPHQGKVVSGSPRHANQRPGVATTFGILNCIWGGLGLIGPPLTLLQVFVDPQGLYRLLGDDFKMWTIFSVGLGFFVSIWLLCTGIGLLKLKPWGRTGTIFYAVYSLVMSIFSSLVVFMTASEIGQAPAAIQGGFVGGFIGALLFSVLYSILLLVFMNSPKMRESYG
jgi:hypothetical protein